MMSYDEYYRSVSLGVISWAGETAQISVLSLHTLTIVSPQTWEQAHGPQYTPAHFSDCPILLIMKDKDSHSSSPATN